MPRIPFETMAPQAQALIDKAALALANGADTAEIMKLYQEFKTYLANCGWTVQEYDKELLAHIDASWEDPNLN